MVIDDLDRKIVQYLSSGTNSYQELARVCNVTRNTVYRRIATLEKEGIIKNTLRCVVNLDKIGITSISIGVRIQEANEDKAISLLATNKNVRFLWRTYGDHNITLVAFCSKGEEGETIRDIRATLEGLKAEHVCVSVGFVWEKMCFSPFNDQSEIEEKITQIITNRYEEQINNE
jgi:DNA-binding Lrp family transcriptional regulator